MEDFNWLKKQASPNWKIMDPDRHVAIEKQMSIFKNNNQSQDLLANGLNLLPK